MLGVGTGDLYMEMCSFSFHFKCALLAPCEAKVFSCGRPCIRASKMLPRGHKGGRNPRTYQQGRKLQCYKHFFLANAGETDVRAIFPHKLMDGIRIGG